MALRRGTAPALLLALATLLAGCLAVPPGTTPTPPGGALGPTGGVVHGADGLAAPGGAALFPASGAALGTGAPAAEPTVGVTPDGTVYLTGFAQSPATGRRFPTLYQSHDLGASWGSVGPTLPSGDGVPPATNDPFVYVDPGTGRVFTLDLIGTACSVLSWSDDDGATWTTNPLACGTPAGNDHQSIVAAKPRALPTVGYDNVVYYCVNRVGDSACATSLNGGLTFGPLRPLVYAGVDGVPDTDGNGVCGGLTGHVAAGPDGKVFLPKAHCGVPTVALTEDDGLTWTVHTISADHRTRPGDHEVRVAVDEAGNVYALWMSEGLPWMARSTDGGATWTPAASVAAPGVTAADFPAIAAGAEGRVAFAYIGTTIEGGYEGKELGTGGLVGDVVGEPEPPEWADATWNAYLAVVTDALADDIAITTVTANDPADPIARGLCGQTRCGGMADFIAVVVDATGRPWASFVDVCTMECVTDPEVKKDAPMGFAATLDAGPALRGDLAALPTLEAARAALPLDGHGHDAAAPMAESPLARAARDARDAGAAAGLLG